MVRVILSETGWQLVQREVKETFVQWNDCIVFLATWVRCCLFLSHPPLPHHPSNGSLFRAPSNTVTSVTIHKQEPIGLGMVSVGQRAVLPAFPLSLERLQRWNSRDISFWIVVELMLYIDIHIFLRVGVQAHSLSVLLKLRVRAILTEIWLCSHIYLRLLETHLFIYFLLLWKAMHPHFILPR